jgi:hypothetical protein
MPLCSGDQAPIITEGEAKASKGGLYEFKAFAAYAVAELQFACRCSRKFFKRMTAEIVKRP